MIKHYLKTMWKSKYKNAFLFFQFFLVFSILFGVLTYGITKYKYFKEELGFNTENVFTATVGFQKDLDSLGLSTLKTQLIANLKSKPEIVEVAFTDSYPFDGMSRRSGDINYSYATKEFFDVLNMKFVSGRNFEDLDNIRKAVVVNKKFMDQYVLTGNGKSEDTNIQNLIDNKENIVGVVSNYKKDGVFSEEKPFIFYMLKESKSIPSLIIKTHSASKPAIEKEISDLLKKLSKYDEISIENLDNIKKNKFKENIIPLMGMLFLALFLIINIAMGLFGVLRYNISKRKSEIGLRKALGATNFEIQKQFVGEMIVLISIALIVALFFAVQIPYITTLPFSIENYILGIGAAIILVYSVVFLCSYFPSREAANTLPANALHEN